MEEVVKNVGCATLVIAIIGIPILTVLCLVYQWGGVLIAFLLMGLDIFIFCFVFIAIKNMI